MSYPLEHILKGSDPSDEHVDQVDQGLTPLFDPFRDKGTPPLRLDTVERMNGLEKNRKFRF